MPSSIRAEWRSTGRFLPARRRARAAIGARCLRRRSRSDRQHGLRFRPRHHSACAGGGDALPRPARACLPALTGVCGSNACARTRRCICSRSWPLPVTGGSVGDAEGRLDFDSGEAVLDKAELERRLNELIALDAAVSQRWIDDAELEANPGLIKTMSVKPPMGSWPGPPGRNRGPRSSACGGTHVGRTGEIGSASVTGIEKEGQDQSSRAHCARRRLTRGSREGRRGTSAQQQSSRPSSAGPTSG